MGAALPSRNLRLAVNLAAIAVGMLMLAYASVPLYRLFCQATGFGGVTQQSANAPTRVYERVIEVRFNADIDPALPWTFAPGERHVPVKVGENRLTYYTAQNLTDAPVTGHAVFNVVPNKAGVYFTKIECFCFTNQTLPPHASVHMPVSFYLDPALLDDPDMNDVREITLSYTFFPATPEPVNPSN